MDPIWAIILVIAYLVGFVITMAICKNAINTYDDPSITLEVMRTLRAARSSRGRGIISWLLSVVWPLYLVGVILFYIFGSIFVFIIEVLPKSLKNAKEFFTSF